MATKRIRTKKTSASASPEQELVLALPSMLGQASNEDLAALSEEDLLIPDPPKPRKVRTGQRVTHQDDLFVANLTDYALKDDQVTMEAAVFALGTKRDLEKYTWTSQDGKKTVTVTAGEYGRATQHDKDVLIFCASQVLAGVREGKKPSRTVVFQAYDFLHTTQRQLSGAGYKGMHAALRRLHNTRIETNIVTGTARTRSEKAIEASATDDTSPKRELERAKFFNLIDEGEVVLYEDQDGRESTVISVTLSKWFYDAIMAKEVLTISHDYFGLRSPTDRRLYEIARKHCGHQATWRIKLKSLLEKCGIKDPRLDRFRNMLVVLSEDPIGLPQYGIRFVEGEKDLVEFVNKSVADKETPRIENAVEEEF